MFRFWPVTDHSLGPANRDACLGGKHNFWHLFIGSKKCTTPEAETIARIYIQMWKVPHMHLQTFNSEFHLKCIEFSFEIRLDNIKCNWCMGIVMGASDLTTAVVSQLRWGSSRQCYWLLCERRWRDEADSGRYLWNIAGNQHSLGFNLVCLRRLEQGIEEEDGDSNWKQQSQPQPWW